MSTHKTSVSVIAPVYNTELYLRDAVESVLKQSFEDWELILIDDGSTDGSAAICDEYAGRDHRIKVKHTVNRGVDPARNLGIELSRGEWITFLDSDDMLTEDALEKLYSNADHCDAVIAGYRETPGTKRYQPATEVQRIEKLAESAEAFIRIDRSFVLSCQHAKLFRKAAIRCYFRENQPFADDTWFNMDNLFDADGIVFLPDYLYLYRRRSDAGALHNTQEGRLETSYALMRRLTEIFVGSDKVREHLTGKMVIRIYNYLLRLVSGTENKEERNELIAQLLQKPLFCDPLIWKAKAPLPELHGFWSALLGKDIETVSDCFRQSVRSDSPGMISVILPVFNMEHTLKTAVDSILAQTYPHWELVIVDDGSTDGSGRIGDAYMEQDARITCIHQENRGAGAARNAGMSYASGEWLAFLDADDTYLPESFERMIHASDGADLVACGIYIDLFRVMCRPYDEIRSFEGLPEGRDLRVFWANYIPLVVWAKLYRRSVVNALFETNVTFGEDTLFNFKVFPNLKRITVIPEQGYFYHMKRERFDRGMLKGSLRILEAAAEWLPDNTTIVRLSYIAFIRSARRFALHVLESQELNTEEKEQELAFCMRMIRLPAELDHEEFLFPENLEWWRQLKEGQIEQAVAGQRILQKEGEKRLESLQPDGWTYAPRG